MAFRRTSPSASRLTLFGKRRGGTSSAQPGAAQPQLPADRDRESTRDPGTRRLREMLRGPLAFCFVIDRSTFTPYRSSRFQADEIHANVTSVPQESLVR